MLLQSVTSSARFGGWVTNVMHIAAYASVGIVVPAVIGCSHAWDDFDPRLVPQEGAASSVVSGPSTGAGGAGGHVPTGGVGAASGVGGADEGSAGSTAASTAIDGGATSVEYVASVADCVGLLAPNPDECETTTGFGLMTVDSLDTEINAPRASFVRFDVGDAFAGRTIDSVTVRAVTGPVSASDQSGQVWRVDTFARQDLFSIVPVKLDANPLAPSTGPTSGEQTIVWHLPADVVAAGTPLCLGIFPVSTDGTDYQNLHAKNPPRLTVTFE